MNSELKPIGNYKSMEMWLCNVPENFFPQYDPSIEKSYSQRYLDLKLEINKIHNAVEKGALLKSVNDWRYEILGKLNGCEGLNGEKIDEFKMLLQHDPSIYLNQHGKGHVDKVIEKAKSLIDKFKFEPPNPYEIFLLLCAIQIHDAGNIFGRENHEKSFQDEFNEIAKKCMLGTPIRNLIFRIASVHSGNIRGDRDTIHSSRLRPLSKYDGYAVREEMLAALLRFSDELADDSSRADILALDIKIVPPESLIYHEYSKALHNVFIDNNDVNRTCAVVLEYYIDFNTATKKFNKDMKEIYLIDEIFDRTIKMEKERRYCMRYLGQYISLSEVRVRIEICPEHDCTDAEEISYTLKEAGYPLGEIRIDCIDNTGDKVVEKLILKGWRM